MKLTTIEAYKRVIRENGLNWSATMKASTVLEFIQEIERCHQYIRILESEPIRSKSVIKRLRTQLEMED